MAHAGKYGDVGIEHIPDDEPVFIIRAQDKLAVPMIVAYQELARREGVEHSFIDHLYNVIDDVEYWQRRNATKVPD